MDFELSSEQKDIRQAAREFALGEFKDIAGDCDQHEKFPPELVTKAGELGFLGAFIDEAYGGARLGFLEHAIILEEFWRVYPGLGSSCVPYHSAPKSSCFSALKARNRNSCLPWRKENPSWDLPSLNRMRAAIPSLLPPLPSLTGMRSGGSRSLQSPEHGEETGTLHTGIKRKR